MYLSYYKVYKVKGAEKKLFSDHHLLIDSMTLSYTVKMKYRVSSPSIILHFGIACYDGDRKLI